MKTISMSIGTLLLFVLLANKSTHAQSSSFTVTNNTSCSFTVTMYVYEGMCDQGGFCNTTSASVAPGTHGFSPICGAGYYWAKMSVSTAVVDCDKTPRATGPDCIPTPGGPITLLWTGANSGELN